MPARLPVVCCVAALLAACGGPREQAAGSGQPVPVVEVTPNVVAETPGAQAEPTAQDGQVAGSSGSVTFQTAAGATLSGTLSGSGQSAVVLSHMFATDQTSWQPFAQVAAEQGYLTLTYDFPGYGVTGGEPDIPALDASVRGAYDFVRAQGAQRVVLVGADVGGTASIKTAAALGDGLAGLVVLSAPRSFNGLEATDAELQALSVPSLWLSARTDMTTLELEEMYDLAAGDKSLWIFEGTGSHGTFLFDAPLEGRDLEGRLLAFLTSVAPPTG